MSCSSPLFMCSSTSFRVAIQDANNDFAPDLVQPRKHSRALCCRDCACIPLRCRKWTPDAEGLSSSMSSANRFLDIAEQLLEGQIHFARGERLAWEWLLSDASMPR